MNATNATMFDQLPAASDLNKIPGFDPRRFLRKKVSEVTQEEVFDLDLKYKKLWFRLKYPAGRIKVTALKITEQIAIIEAKIFFDKNDTEPVSSFISQRYAKEKPGSLYIERAQHAAQDQALTDAGFGVQFSLAGESSGAEIRNEPGATAQASTDTKKLPTQSNAPTQAAQVKAVPTEPAQTADTPSKNVLQNTAETGEIADLPDATTQDAQVTAASTEPAQTAETPADTVSQDTTETVADSPDTPAQSEEQAVTAAAENEQAPEATSDAASEQAQTDNGAAIVIQFAESGETAGSVLPLSRFTPDMPVDDICALMTLEEAEAVVVDSGTCKGWTLADVNQKRRASLKFYLNGYTGDNNLMRAGAKILLESGLERIAG